MISDIENTKSRIHMFARKEYFCRNNRSKIIRYFPRVQFKDKTYHFFLGQEFSHFNFCICSSFSPKKKTKKSKTRNKFNVNDVFHQKGLNFRSIFTLQQTFIFSQIISIKSSPPPCPAEYSYLSTEFLFVEMGGLSVDAFIEHAASQNPFKNKSDIRVLF